MSGNGSGSRNGHVNSSGKYISILYRHMQMLITPRMEPFRIGSGQYIFLLGISGREGISQKALSEELLIDKTTTAKAIRKLETEGYIRRETDPEDQRYNRLYLTDEGKRIVPEVRAVLEEVTRLSREGLSDEEYELLLNLLQRMLLNVCGLVRGKGDKGL